MNAFWSYGQVRRTVIISIRFFDIPLRSMMDFKALVMLMDRSRAGGHSFVFKEDFLSSVRFSLVFSLVFPRSRTETATNILS